jgi:hypothetical protein
MPLPNGTEDREFAQTADPNQVYCLGRAVEHGQKAAMRWLIEFVGIALNRKGVPDRPSEFDPASDVSIQSFAGPGVDLQVPINVIDRKSPAWLLADVWKGCSQSSVHATFRTNHPSADSPELDVAFRLVVEHLQRTIYGPTFRLVDLVRAKE